MTDSLLVVLDDAVAGTLVRLKGGKLRFDYTATGPHRHRSRCRCPPRFDRMVTPS